MTQVNDIYSLKLRNIYIYIKFKKNFFSRLYDQDIAIDKKCVIGRTNL